MAKEWAYQSVDNWFICDVCGFKYRASVARRRWDGLMVCPSDFEYRQPQDFVKAKTDKIVADIIRPRTEDTFLPVCDMMSIRAVADVGAADCAIVGYTGDGTYFGWVA